MFCHKNCWVRTRAEVNVQSGNEKFMSQQILTTTVASIPVYIFFLVLQENLDILCESSTAFFLISEASQRSEAVGGAVVMCCVNASTEDHTADQAFPSSHLATRRLPLTQLDPVFLRVLQPENSLFHLNVECSWSVHRFTIFLDRYWNELRIILSVFSERIDKLQENI